MADVLATMFTMTTYGTWLRGDQRGWVDDGRLMPPNPMLEEVDRMRMKFPVYVFAEDRRRDVGMWLGEALIRRQRQRILALAVRTWHVHFVVAASSIAISAIAKCAKESARYGLNAGRPIWGDDYDKRFCFDEVSLENRIRYVERHNEEDGLGPRPWEFIERAW